MVVYNVTPWCNGYYDASSLDYLKHPSWIPAVVIFWSSGARKILRKYFDSGDETTMWGDFDRETLSTVVLGWLSIAGTLHDV